MRGCRSRISSRLFAGKRALFLAAARCCLADTARLFTEATEGLAGEEALRAMANAYTRVIVKEPERLLMQMQVYVAVAAGEADGDAAFGEAVRAEWRRLWDTVHRPLGADTGQHHVHGVRDAGQRPVCLGVSARGPALGRAVSGGAGRGPAAGRPPAAAGTRLTPAGRAGPVGRYGGRADWLDGPGENRGAGSGPGPRGAGCGVWPGRQAQGRSPVPGPGTRDPGPRPPAGP